MAVSFLFLTQALDMIAYVSKELNRASIARATNTKRQNLLRKRIRETIQTNKQIITSTLARLGPNSPYPWRDPSEAYIPALAPNFQGLCGRDSRRIFLEREAAAIGRIGQQNSTPTQDILGFLSSGRVRAICNIIARPDTAFSRETLDQLRRNPGTVTHNHFEYNYGGTRYGMNAATGTSQQPTVDTANVVNQGNRLQGNFRPLLLLRMASGVPLEAAVRETGAPPALQAHMTTHVQQQLTAAGSNTNSRDWARNQLMQDENILRAYVRFTQENGHFFGAARPTATDTTGQSQKAYEDQAIQIVRASLQPGATQSSVEAARLSRPMHIYAATAHDQAQAYGTNRMGPISGQENHLIRSNAINFREGAKFYEIDTQAHITRLGDLESQLEMLDEQMADEQAELDSDISKLTSEKNYWEAQLQMAKQELPKAIQRPFGMGGGMA